MSTASEKHTKVESPSGGTIDPTMFGRRIRELPTKEDNPSSRYFGHLVFPFGFKKGALELEDQNLVWNGAIIVNWNIDIPFEDEKKDSNPSSRTFGKLADVRELIGNDYQETISI